MNAKKIAVMAALFLLAISERTVLDLGPNIELITTTMLLCSFYYGYKESLLLVASIMFFSDVILGNSNIFWFTWSGFLLPALLVHKFIKNNIVISATATGLASNLFFYFWTNFGVWLIGNLYPPTFNGLLLSYINALPFLKLQLVSTLLFVPIGFFMAELIHSKNLTKEYDHI